MLTYKDSAEVTLILDKGLEAHLYPLTANITPKLWKIKINAVVSMSRETRVPIMSGAWQARNSLQRERERERARKASKNRGAEDGLRE